MELTVFSDETFMKEALKEANKAFDADEVPVGVVVVCNNRIIARGHNLTERLNDVTAHAEMQAITAAANYLGGKYLHECTMFVTLEPCVMCAGAMHWAQLQRLVFGAHDPKKGFLRL
ncbi:MAG TPA: nucleoside deaminase, partial [Bacteroidia bacterium]|nr:nucleoside deaminase [Bacteroidia bacterium]